jgi:hypothetical protein
MLCRPLPLGFSEMEREDEDDSLLHRDLRFSRSNKNSGSECLGGYCGR